MHRHRHGAAGAHAVLLLCLLLGACGGSAEMASLPGSCSASASASASAGSRWLSGTVTAVHDGDSLSLSTASGTEHIRLQGLDAPELAQAYGNVARQALSQQTLQQAVRVAYEDRDGYQRVLGQVFTVQCMDVNLQLLQSGMAWFYRAYACDLDSARRTRYAQAEADAQAQRLGLWRQNTPVAPWVYRNGEDPQAPLCGD